MVTGGRRRIRAGMLGLVCILIGYFMIYTTAYIIIVPDAADIVCGAKNFMWSNFAIYAFSCGAKMNSTFLSVEQKGQI